MKPDNILELRDISLAFTETRSGRRDVHLLDRLTLSVPLGKVTALVGGNGAGKTTLFNIISGFQHADAGEIKISHEDTRTRSDEKNLRAFVSSCETNSCSFVSIRGLPSHRIADLGVGRLFQGRQLFPSLTLLENFKLADDDHTGEIPFSRLFSPSALRRAEAAKEAEARAILEEVFGPNNKYLDMLGTLGGAFSFGEQRLLALARLLMSQKTRLLLLDEPTAGVNPAICETIAKIIRGAVTQHGLSVFLIEHNMPFVRQVADHCAYMAGGKIALEGTPLTVLDSAEVRASYLGLQETSHEDTRTRSDEKNLRAFVSSCETTLTLKNITAGYETTRDILQDANLTVADGEAVGIIGLNGSGKSTLGKAALNLLPRRAGRVTLSGADVSAHSTAQLAREGVGLMMQGAPVFDQLTVAENIRLAAGCDQRVLTAAAERLAPVFPQFFTHETQSHLRADKLSGGQRHQLALCLALVKQAKLLILDEPSAGLDPAAADTLYKTLMQIRVNNSVSILLIEQNVQLARDFCHRVLVMRQGKLEETELSSADANGKENHA